MKRPALRLLAVVLTLGITCSASRAETGEVATRYGKVEAVSVENPADHYDVRFRGKTLARMEALYVSMKKLTSPAVSDVILIDAGQSGLYCRHQFRLLELKPDGSATMSSQFGDCMELFGARFIGENPVVQLIDPAGTNAGVPPRVHEFAKAKSGMKELPAVHTPCGAYELAVPAHKQVTPELTRRTIVGEGRAYFHTAPVEDCRDKSLFLIPGDGVEVSAEFDGYAKVNFYNNKTNKKYSGWLKLERLGGG